MRKRRYEKKTLIVDTEFLEIIDSLAYELNKTKKFMLNEIIKLGIIRINPELIDVAVTHYKMKKDMERLSKKYDSDTVYEILIGTKQEEDLVDEEYFDEEEQFYERRRY